jgi:hypothetical protein
MDIEFRMLKIYFWMARIVKYCFDVDGHVVEFWQNLIETASREFWVS